MSTYTPLSLEQGDIVNASNVEITTGLWTGDTGSFGKNNAYLWSNQMGLSGEYYADVYDLDRSIDDDAEVQFAIAYGHVEGGGAPNLSNSQTATLPTKAIYGQYRQLLLESGDARFNFEGVDTDHVYVINLQRSRVREIFDPGNWELPLSGANGVFTLIDDSKQTLGNIVTTNTTVGRRFSVVSGSINEISGSVTASVNARSFNGHGYGFVYPDLGIMVLNPEAICPMVGFYTSGSGDTKAWNLTGSAMYYSQSVPAYTAPTNYLAREDNVPFAPLTHSIGYSNGTVKSAYNHIGLFTSLTRALDGGYEFRARAAETITSTHYFVRLRNTQYNYSNNPTFFNPDTGNLIQSSFIFNPRVYITTVGLYNDNNELLAVAKLSSPVRKSFEEEVLLRVRLDF